MAVDSARFAAAWTDAPPRWAQLLRAACDRTTQREVADQLRVSSGYVSRILYNDYPGSMEEAERKVLATFAADTVACPLWPEPIALKTCIRNRRRKSPPRNQFHHAYDRTCPSCPLNTDLEAR